MSVLKPLNDPELQEYYEALFVMFSTLGWKKLMEDNGRMIELHNQLVGIETIEQLHFRKGQVDQMEWLKNLQEATEHAYKSLLEKQEGVAGAASATTGGGVAKVIDPNHPVEE